MKLPQIVKSISILFALSILASCGDTSDSINELNSAPNGRVSILVTDAPSPVFDQINITIESVSFLAEDDTQEAEKEIILFNETRVVNLLALQNFSDLLATTIVPAGTYSKIRLHVSQVELVNLNPDGTVAESHIAKLPANGKIDLNPQGSFDVIGDGHLVIELDMDAEKSIHIVATGKGYNFRPVIFVNILGEEELKLLMLEGKVLAKSEITTELTTETEFQLCDVDATEVNDNCLAVLITGNTVVQNNLIDVVDQATLAENDIVTVLGKVNSKTINALHIVITGIDKEAQNIALFTGAANSVVDIDNVFGMETDDDNTVVPPQTLLSVAIADGARIFDEYGTEASSDIIVIGTDVDVFGLASPDLDTASKVKAAFVIYNNDIENDNISGTIAEIYIDESQILVTVTDGSVTVNKCVDIDTAYMFLLKIVGENIVNEEITINDLQIGMPVDVYGEDEGLSCMSADVVLVTEN